MPISTVECCDCMDFMAKFPDKHFELAIVDPPYGIGISNNPVRQMHNRKTWDKSVPSKRYFDELFRVSQNQIIWGGNYFDMSPTQNYIVWNKLQPMDFSLAMCELAWCSIQRPIKMFTYSVSTEKHKIHPTQKPVALYVWLLQNYAKPGDKILDTHMGSQSSRIAAHQMGFDFWGCEIDPEYFADGCKRFEKETEQQALFTPETTTEEQNKLFEEVTP
jgi:site-specific DNA-methyltransferase (adenine-specific)